MHSHRGLHGFTIKATINTIDLVIRIVRFLAIIAAFYVLYKLLLEQFLDGSKEILPLFGLWLMTSYLVIPKIHRTLTGYYLPNYFVGRIRSSSGLLSDPVNLAFYGDERSIHIAMKKAGWDMADELTVPSMINTAFSSLLHKSYRSAPVGDMFLFDRKQDFAYEQEVEGSPSKRHHVRFWKTPDNWYLPGGHKADWLAAATYDTHVGLKIATGQLDHYIHANVDEERDYIIKTLEDSKAVEKVEVVKHFTNAYHDRNNGGDRIKTDGSLPFISV